MSDGGGICRICGKPYTKETKYPNRRMHIECHRKYNASNVGFYRRLEKVRKFILLHGQEKYEVILRKKITDAEADIKLAKDIQDGVYPLL